MPKLNPQEMERRRGRIVAAARLCFSRDGFSDCSMDEICAEAGLSKGAVYNHFSSKEELIYAVADEQGRSLQRLVDGKSLEEMRDSLLDIFAHPADGPDARLEFHAMSRAFTDEGLRVRMRRNAALVEEAAAAAGSLQDQAAKLSQVVSVFKLGASFRTVQPAEPAVLRATRAPGAATPMPAGKVLKLNPPKLKSQPRRIAR